MGWSVVPKWDFRVYGFLEAADTLAALKHAHSMGMEQTLTIRNVSTGAMVRECKLAYITRAGIECGVASTKLRNLAKGVTVE